MINCANNYVVKKKAQIKICFISLFGYPLYNKNCKESFGGGAEIQLYFLSKEFSKDKNLDVNVITGNYKINKNKNELFSNIKIFKVLPIKSSIFNYLNGLVNFFLTLIRMNPDIVIQRGGDIFTGLSAFYCKIFKKKFVFSIAHHNDVIKGGKPLKKKFFHIYGLINADFIIAQNNEQILLLEKWRNKKITNIKVIKNCFKIQNIKGEKKNFILWVARADKWKRAELYLELAKKFPNEPFLLICNKSSDENYWNTIYNKASEISNLKFLKFIPFHKINQYFKESKVFINTSTYEGFPNTFIQALKNKTPIISLNINPDQIFTENEIGFYCNNNISKMEDYLKLIIKNKELYDLYSKNAYNYVINNHDIEKISKEWISLIKKIFNN